jgi:hypothetical protein
MKAYQLLARLNLLTLAGYENGEYIWIGTDKKWNMIDSEEARLLRQ